jgi:transcriptional regulator with XRE-family HTH domain
MQPDGAPARPLYLAVDNDRLDALRVAHGITSDADFARRIGVNPATLWRVREGQTVASNEFLAKVAAAFPNAPLDALFRVVKGGER